MFVNRHRLVATIVARGAEEGSASVAPGFHFAFGLMWPCWVQVLPTAGAVLPSGGELRLCGPAQVLLACYLL
jgi:hypothetical protein